MNSKVRGTDTPMALENGRIVLPSGTEYRVLLLPDLPGQ